MKPTRTVATFLTGPRWGRPAIHATCVLVVWLLCAFAGAQNSDADQIATDLKSRSQQLDALARELDSPNIPRDRLDRYIKTLTDYDTETDSEIETLEDALQEPKSRLLTLGPPPGPGEQPESQELSTLRSQLTEQVARLTGLSKEAQLTKAVIGELIDRIEAKRRARLLTSLRTRGPSPLSGDLWSHATAQVQPAFQALRDYYQSRQAAPPTRTNRKADLALLLAALALALGLLLLPRWRGWRRFEARLTVEPDPSATSKRRFVAVKSLSRGLLVFGAVALLYLAGLETALITPADEELMARVCLGAAAWTFIYRFGRGFFSPSDAAWRMAHCDPHAARLLQRLWVGAFSVFVLDRLSYLTLAQIDAGTELLDTLRILMTAAFATLLWFLLSPRLWPHGAAAHEGLSRPREALRRAGRALAVALIGLLVLGYVRMASFLFHRLCLLFLFVLLFWCVHALSVWALSKLPTTPRPAQSEESDDDQTGEVDDAETNLGFWLRLGLELNLLLVAVPGFLLVVGFDWLEVRRVFEWLGSDVHLGKLSLSFPDVLLAVIVFFFVSAGTRWVTALVERRLLEGRTSAEAQAQSSVATLINYAGLLIGLLIALPIAGIGFSKLALIAGALSVGIGFGLQTIVNNFVSGLILLFERPIRAGDWVVVQSGEGYVKSIGARATEIRTFDGSSIIIPNSELVSSAVQNWFHGNRVGRIRITVGVAYESNPQQVRDILVQCANEHDSIMPYPAPDVIFDEFGDSSLNFQLRAYLRNYDSAFRVQSDLRFAIFDAFEKAGIVIPFPQRDVHVYSEPITRPKESDDEA